MPTKQERTNRMTGAEAMVRMLEGHGVRHVFGLCGDTSLPFYDALARLDHNIAHILTRDERHAAYMADGYARVTGKPGICEGPSGGGATYILPGLAEANDSSVPILAINSDVSTASAGLYPLTELDQERLFAPVTKWNGTIRSADHLPRMVRKAFREMTTGRPGAVHLALPFDVQKATVPPEDVWAESRFSRYPALPAAPNPTDAETLVDALLAADNPVVICGGGVVLAGASSELAAFAERLDIAICTTISGQGSLAETHPNCVGVIGSNGGVPATRAVVEQADCVFFLGCRAGSVTTERWRIPDRSTTILHMDNDPAVIGACYETRAAMVCDAKEGLRALLEHLEERGPITGKGGARRAAAARAEKWKGFERAAAAGAPPIRPEQIMADLHAVLPPEAIVCADPGTPCPYFSAWFEWPEAGRHFITNRAHGALGFSLGASIGAQFGAPNAKVVCAMGDGSFAMTAGEFETLERLGLPITVLVFSNSVFGWIKAGQKAGFGERYFSVDFTRTDHAAVARAYGIRSWRVEEPAKLRDTLKTAIAFDGPSLVDIAVLPLHEAAPPVSEWVA